MEITLVGLEMVPGLVVRVRDGGKVEVDASRARVVPVTGSDQVPSELQVQADLTPLEGAPPATC
jgi:hypothetical protein